MIDLSNMVQKSNVVYDHIPIGSILLFAGRPKTGKSTAASTFSPTGKDGVLTLDFECGAVYLEKGASYIPITSLGVPLRQNSEGAWEAIPPLERGLTDSKGQPKASYSYKEVYDTLISGFQSSPYTCVCIDSITAFYRMMEERVLSDLIAKALADPAGKDEHRNATSLQDFGYGEGYSIARIKTLDRVLAIRDIVKKKGYVLLNGHHKNTLVMENNDKKKSKMQLKLDLPDGLADRLSQMSEFIGTFSVTDAGAYVCDISSKGVEGASGTRFKPVQGKRIIFRETGDHTLYNRIMAEFLTYNDKLNSQEA